MSTNTPVPDGGYGWVIVFGYALSNIFNNSLVSVFGLLFSQQLADLGLTSTGAAALVLNINIILMNMSGLLIKKISGNYSLRTIFTLGCLITAIGICLCSQATTASQIIFAFGVPTGIGEGLMNASGFLAVNSYFDKNRGKAIGIALAGTAIGQVMMPFVVKELLDEYGSRGAILIIGGLTLHGLIGGCLFIPNRRYTIPEEEEKEEPLEDNEILDENYNLIQKEKRPSYLAEKLQDMIGIHLLMDLSFLNIAIGIALLYTVSVNFALILPYFLQETIQLSRTDTALVLTTLACGDVASRLTIPIFTDRLKVPARITLLIGLMLLMLMRSVLAESTTLFQILFVAACFGYIRATTVVNQFVCLAELYPDQQMLSSAVGLSMIFKAISVITVGQLLGILRDFTNSYVTTLHLQNIVLSIVAISWTGELLYRKCSSKRKEYERL